MNKLALLTGAALLSNSAGAQTTLSAADWQADLRFLQRTVHEDYPFLFKKITAAEFDALVEDLNKSIPRLEPHEIVAGLARVVASFGYGHTELSWRGAPVRLHSLPLNLYWFSVGVFVEGAHADCVEALGARVVQVEGKPIEEALAAIRPLVPAENEQFFKAHGLGMLLMPEALHAQGLSPKLKSTVTLTLARDGETIERTFEAGPLARIPRPYGFVRPGGSWSSVRAPGPSALYLRSLSKPHDFEYLADDKTVYVRQSQIQDGPDEPIPELYARVFEFIEQNDVERLVLDLRLNGGGNNYKNKPIVVGLLRCAKIDRPGGLFVIIGRRTFSACQNLVNELDNFTHAIFVGEPTAENINFFGDTNVVELPNSKTPVRLSFAWWQDKPQWENADWLAPDIAVEASFADHCANRDPVLATILMLAGEGFVGDPATHLRTLLANDTLEAFVGEAQRLAVDDRHAFFDFETELNRTGYELLGADKVDDAVSVLALNAQLYPESANCWDSLGEACWRAGRKEKALAHYDKAIALDPDGAIGRNAREMRNRIEDGE